MEKRFNHAIVKLPSHEMIHGLSFSGLGVPDYFIAIHQHVKYIEALEYCGLTVKILDADNRFPDSTFIEDIALCTRTCAIITNPGAPTRKGEVEGMKSVLGEFYSKIFEIVHPGTVEAGDVMMVSDHFFIGISERTNETGADQLIQILSRSGYSGSKIPLKRLLHLKSGTSYLENNNLLVTGESAGFTEFRNFNRIVISQDEAYSANSLWINGRVLIPDGYPKTKSLIEKEGYETIPLDVSEFRKLDGGLSCLSLRF